MVVGLAQLAARVLVVGWAAAVAAVEMEVAAAWAVSKTCSLDSGTTCIGNVPGRPCTTPCNQESPRLRRVCHGATGSGSSAVCWAAVVALLVPIA